jgi:ubiquinone/menaquinone biosynthesis C-methylase UbiE
MSNFLKKYVSNQSSYFSCKDEDNIRLLETANRLLQYSKKKTIKNCNLLDLGGGNGSFAKVCNDKGIKASFLDASSHNIDFNNDTLPFDDNHFDFVTIFAVIEHINNIVNFIYEAKRVLKTNGTIIITTPNFRYCYKNFYDDPTHVRPFTNISINNFLINAGFKNIVTKPLLVKKPNFYWDLKYTFRLASLLPFTNHEYKNFPIPSFLRGKSTSIICLAEK